MRRSAAAVLAAVCSVGALGLASADDQTTLQPARSGLDDAGTVEPDGVLVLAVLSPERAMVADPRTGQTSQRRLAGGTLCHGPVLAVGEHVILSGSSGRRPVALSLPLTLRGRSRSLGRADTVTVSDIAGRLWLGQWSTPDDTAPRASLREVDANAGRITRTAELPPRWSTIEALVDNRFLGTDAHGLALSRRPLGATQQTIRNGSLLAAHRTRFAWCRGDCRRLTLWTRDSERTLAAPDDLRPQLGGRAAFSPDGRRLALPVETHRGPRVGVLDLATRTWTVIAGARLAGYQSIAWSPSGHWLYFTGARHRLLAWQAGSRRLVRLPIRPGGSVMSIATTQTPRGDD
jgi:hypothetical protein